MFPWNGQKSSSFSFYFVVCRNAGQCAFTLVVPHYEGGQGPSRQSRARASCTDGRRRSNAKEHAACLPARPSTFSGACSHVSACGNNGSRSVRSYCGSKGAKAVSLLPSVPPSCCPSLCSVRRRGGLACSIVRSPPRSLPLFAQIRTFSCWLREAHTEGPQLQSERARKGEREIGEIVG